MPLSENHEFVKTEAEARRLAETRWPGSRFALTTIRKMLELRRPDVAKEMNEHGDVVVIAVLAPTWTPLQQGGRLVPDAEVYSVLGIIGATVHGPACMPFTSQVWGKDLIDYLTTKN